MSLTDCSWQLNIKILCGACVQKNWSNVEFETNAVLYDPPMQGQVGSRMVKSHSAVAQCCRTVLSHSVVANLKHAEVMTNL